MQALDAPVYEVNKESDWYIRSIKRQEDIDNFFKRINNEFGFEDNGFSFYHSEYFGVTGKSKDYEKFKGELLKNPTSDGFYAFKKRSKYYPMFKGMIEEIEDVSPFKPHDVFGSNNIKASQWIGDRWFYSIKRDESIESEEVSPIPYKDYLQILMDNLGE